jgi:hypothetical protein
MITTAFAILLIQCFVLGVRYNSQLRARIQNGILLCMGCKLCATTINGAAGDQWDINRSFAILAEFGFGKRSSQMLNLNYRF